MKKLLTSLATLAFVTAAANAAGPVYINEMLANPPGSDSSTTPTGNERFELRGPPGLSLLGYYLISIEGQGTTGRGDINQFFDLGANSLGANGYLFARENGSLYTTTDPGATVIQNTSGRGWGVTGSSTVGHSGDGTQYDLENSATTILLIKVDTGAGGVAPVLTQDLDANDDGLLDPLPTGWTVADSVGLLDGAGPPAATDWSYGAITFRVAWPAGTYLGTSAYSNIIDVPGVYTSDQGSLLVARKGESTGSTTNDWVGTIVDGGSAANPLGFIFASPTDSSFAGLRVSDMVFGGTNLSTAPAGTVAYAPTVHGTRFTANTVVTPTGLVGDTAVDPRDNTTILFAINNFANTGGGIYRAYKVASGNWWVDSTPVVANLDRPRGVIVDGNGTIWWIHLINQSLMRLQAPWSENTPQTVITNFVGTADDDPIDLVFAPSSFSGPPGQPGWLVIADSGSDDNAYNALYLQDPASLPLDFINNNPLVPATTSGLGWADIRGIDALPQYGEVVTLSTDGFLSGINGSGAIRDIPHPAITIANGECLAVDPVTGRVWVGEDTANEIWSIDANPSSPTAEVKEVSFPLVNPPVPFWSIDMQSPGMAFSTNGAFLVVSDGSTVGGGGHLVIFHSETYAPYSLSSFSVTNVSSTVEGPKLEWTPAGPASFNLKYVVQRTTNLANPASFATINAVTATSYTDTNATATAAYYRILAKP